MTSEPVTDLPPSPAPNHHASHPGFSGVGGLVAAVTFLFAGNQAATLAPELIGLRSGERLVDIGCGPGVAARRAAATGAEVVVVDPASVMLRVARLRWRSVLGVDWRNGAAESLPVEDGWAQVAWSLSTVHHWVDIDDGLAEIWRVLAPGGRLVVLERQIHDTEATGIASHGWTTEQAESFAEHCRRQGFVEVGADTHPGRPTVLSVVAHRPA